MRTLTAFSFVTLNGFFEGPNGDISWHRHGEEENSFAGDMLRKGSTLLFGRITYQLMAGYWPSQEAVNETPALAAAMNSAEKIVFSRTMKSAEWNNTRLVTTNAVEEIHKLKTLPGNDMAVLGSGSIVTQAAGAGLIDEFQTMVDPVLLGSGTPLFKGLKGSLDLRLTGVKTYKSGVVLLSHRPVHLTKTT